MTLDNDKPQHLEILDEEFQGYLDVTKEIMKSLKRPKDRKICARFIRRCQNLNALNLEVKLNRNEFFKYFLRTLKATAENQPPEYDNWFQPRIQDDTKEESYWSTDKRTYIAVKSIPGYGTLVYMAVAYKPELGWQSYGFESYQFEI